MVVKGITLFHNSRFNVVLRSSTNWTTRVDITTNNDRENEHPQITVTADNTLHFVHSSDYAGSNAFRYNSATNMFSFQTVANPSNNLHNAIRLEADTSDNLHLVYNERSSGCISKVVYVNSLNWNSKTDVSQAGIEADWPILRIDGANNAHVVYQSREQTSSYDNIAYRISTNWANLIHVTTNLSGNAIYPNLFIPASGNAAISYQSFESVNFVENIAIRRSADMMTLIPITSGVLPSEEAQVLVDGQGKLHIVYFSREYNQQYYNLAYRIH